MEKREKERETKGEERKREKIEKKIRAEMKTIEKERNNGGERETDR